MKPTDFRDETSISEVIMGTAGGGDIGGSLPGAVTVVGIQGIPVSTTPPTAGQTLIYDIVSNTYILGTSTADMVPTLLAAADTFIIPVGKQALFAMLIDVEGILDVEGYLIEVA